ncbi:hypothetical protein F2P81_011109 [Scophthalmus maximus]|uniref:Uncharacterized protein n=1 Tax=Scophthalmus maximus TaxID=52904 RepID=A0A6A4SQY3_SCOMX|nr:hypothetical protein F2P81_011109 [Scophthalmus maximus]
MLLRLLWERETMSVRQKKKKKKKKQKWIQKHVKATGHMSRARGRQGRSASALRKLLVRYRSNHPHGYQLFHDAVAMELTVMLHRCFCIFT